jgi:glutathione S-transferase
MYEVIGALRTRTFRVLWMLEEMGLDYHHVQAPPRSPEILAVNPSGKVPALKVGDTVITDSVAIMTYLADHHEDLTYAAGTLERARQDAMTGFILDEMDGVLWMAGKHKFVLPKERRVPEILDSLKWEFEQSQARFADRIGTGPFVMGETMTLTDILAAHCGNWAERFGFPMVDPVWIAYLDRMRARPAFRKLDAG